MLRQVITGSVLIIATASLLSAKKINPLPPEVATWRKLYSSGNPSAWPAPDLHPDAKPGYREIGVLPEVPMPADNHSNPSKIALGKTLFYDPRLSSSGQIACASCHDPQLGWGDGKRVAFGHDRKLGSRNAMTLWNVAYYESLFWDGRATSLEDQARFPVQDHLEMNEKLDGMEKRLRSFAGYKTLFAQAFNNDSAITNEKIFKAIAAFERTIVSPKSRFDLFVSGKADALTDTEVWGMHLFRTKAGCVNCHNGGLFADNKFHNDGQTLFGSASEDLGLYNVTGNKADVGKFKTPSLREIVHTGPWMHHGNFPSLKDVLFFYNLGNPAPIQAKYKGDRDSILPKTSPMLKKLNLSNEEIDAVIAFLQSISTTPRRLNPPQQFPQ
ncbi:MAG: cytochrome-c peroxidase [Chitinophagaceae bacterium]|nr:cytochrome-c peroxidase [Chitinophagaceae bacterium]